MITLNDYLTQHCKPENVPGEVASAGWYLLQKVQKLLADPSCPVPNPGLRSGYRPPDFNNRVPNAATDSKHMTGHAIDLSDPTNELDDWLTDEILTKYDLYREHPRATETWCHLQDLPPNSGHRTYIPF